MMIGATGDFFSDMTSPFNTLSCTVTPSFLQAIHQTLKTLKVSLNNLNLIYIYLHQLPF